jgi:hypothetical protein
MTKLHFRPKRLAWVVLPGDFTRYTIRLIRRAVARANREDPYFEFRVVQAPPPPRPRPRCRRTGQWQSRSRRVAL